MDSQEPEQDVPQPGFFKSPEMLCAASSFESAASSMHAMATNMSAAATSLNSAAIFIRTAYTPLLPYQQQQAQYLRNLQMDLLNHRNPPVMAEQLSDVQGAAIQSVQQIPESALFDNPREDTDVPPVRAFDPQLDVNAEPAPEIQQAAGTSFSEDVPQERPRKEAKKRRKKNW